MVAAVLEHAREELLGGLLGRGHVLGLLVHRQEQPRLQLEQRGDQDQELGRGLEVELARLLEVLDVGDDDLAQLDFGEVHALAQDDRHEEVEWAREDVELEVQIGYRHEGQSSHGTGRGHGRPAATRLSCDAWLSGTRRGDGESSRPHALDIYERVCDDTAEELSRPQGSLSSPALFAGLTIGLAPLAVALATTSLGEDVKSTAFIASLLYPIGYVAVIIGRSQFFTENTLYPVMLSLRRPEYLNRTARLWLIVLPMNLVGAFIFAGLAIWSGALDPTVKDQLVANGVDYTDGEFWDTFWSAIVDRLPARAGRLARGGLRHRDRPCRRDLVPHLPRLAGQLRSLHRDYGHRVRGLLDGALSMGETIEWFIPVLAGNVVGGVAIVAAINYGQVREED